MARICAGALFGNRAFLYGSGQPSGMMYSRCTSTWQFYVYPTLERGKGAGMFDIVPLILSCTKSLRGSSVALLYLYSLFSISGDGTG